MRGYFSVATVLTVGLTIAALWVGNSCTEQVALCVRIEDSREDIEGLTRLARSTGVPASIRGEIFSAIALIEEGRSPVVPMARAMDRANSSLQVSMALALLLTISAISIGALSGRLSNLIGHKFVATGELLKSTRVALGLSQKQLAQQLETNQARISRMENGI
jgi:transcriptional regulator with XRE-family HTH domain